MWGQITFIAPHHSAKIKLHTLTADDGLEFKPKKDAAALVQKDESTDSYYQLTSFSMT